MASEPSRLTAASLLRSFVRSLVSVFRGWGHGYGRLSESHAASVAGDALVAVALAGSLFFSVPSTEARSNVALYLLLTLAPFALLGPLLGRLFEKSPGAYRSWLAFSAVGRAGVAVAMMLTVDSLWLFPFAFVSLVLSRLHGISRSAVLPVVVKDTRALIGANAQLARAGVIAAAIVVPLGAALGALIGPVAVLAASVAVYLVSAVSAYQLPAIRRLASDSFGDRLRLSRSIRLTQFATAGVRFLNGYLVLLIAFALTEGDSGFGGLAVLLGAAGFGYFVSAWAAPTIGAVVREEPMVVGALAIEAIAAFVAVQLVSLAAAAVLVGAAGFAWGTAKFAFDGMMHRTVPEHSRARAFTNAETMFQIAWVIGALIPVLPIWPTALGLSSAGVLALIIQVGYVSLVLVPESDSHVPEVVVTITEPDTMTRPTVDRMDVLDLI